MINKLVENIKKTGAPIVVGLDPMMKFIPEFITKKAFAEYGETLEGAAEAIWQYNKGIVDAIYDLVPAVKPQIAMYEQFGVAGLIAFQKTVAYCKEKGLVVIKPSGVDYDTMKASDMVVVDLETGKVVEGDLNPSSDTPTHLVLYRAFPELGGVVHTHSTYATAWAQAGLDIPNIGTTHADYFHDCIPCTDAMTEDMMAEYEHNTGVVIVDRFKKDNINPVHTPGVLVKNHGPFTWGKDADQAVYHAVVAEQVAKMAFISFSVNPNTTMNPLLVEKHFNRKHGPNAYYGQKKH